MKMYYSQKYNPGQDVDEEYIPVSIKESIEKTRRALDIAYAGFDNAVDVDLIDSYIYEIISLQKRYKHLVELAATEAAAEEPVLCKHSPIRALVSHVFGQGIPAIGQTGINRL